MTTMAARLNMPDALPAPPAHEREAARARGFSITSDKSAHSRKSDGKEKLKESHDEKSARKLSISTKANPNAAMNELQPIAQQLQPTTMGCLRDNQYLDMLGNPITDPDLSNPTRRRTERPLETILSFESAIEREYRKQREANRNSYMQNADSDDAGLGGGYAQSRRTSYWGGGDYSGNSYYTHGNASRRSQFDAPPSRNKYGARQMSDSALSKYDHTYSVYSTPGYGVTRDTLNTGGSNGSASDQWQNSTNPSSENASIERKQAEGGEYFSHGYPTPQREPISEDGHYMYGNGGYNPSYRNGSPAAPGAHYGGPPPPPKHMGGSVPSPQKQVISLGGGGDVDSKNMRPTISEIPKRKSWLKRTFSANRG